jgi:hypothetical protein
MDLKTLSLKELKSLKTRVEKEIARRAVTEKKKALKELQAIAQARGFPARGIAGCRRQAQSAGGAPPPGAGQGGGQIPRSPGSETHLERPRPQAEMGAGLACRGQFLGRPQGLNFRPLFW